MPWKQFEPSSKNIFYWPFQDGASFEDHFCELCFVFVMFSCLIIAALWWPAGKGLTSWLSFDVLLCFCHFPMWYPGSGAALDSIDSWSLPSFLVTYNKARMVHCMNKGVTGYNFQNIVCFFLWRWILSKQTVQTLMKCHIMWHFIRVFTVQTLIKCHIMWHFIRVFTVCQSTCLGVSGPQRLVLIFKKLHIWPYTCS